MVFMIEMRNSGNLLYNTVSASVERCCCFTAQITHKNDAGCVKSNLERYRLTLVALPAVEKFDRNNASVAMRNDCEEIIVHLLRFSFTTAHRTSNYPVQLMLVAMGGGEREREVKGAPLDWRCGRK